MSANPSYASWPHRELHARPPWPGSHRGVAPVPAHPSHVSWRHRELHPMTQWLGSHGGVRARFGAPLKHCVAPRGGKLRMVASRPFGTPSYASWPHRECQRKWQGSQGGATLISANPSYASWPHKELHLQALVAGCAGWRHDHLGTTHRTFRDPIRSSTQGHSGKVRMVASRPFRHTPPTLRGSMGGFFEGPSGRVRMVASRPFRHTLTRSVAP